MRCKKLWWKFNYWRHCVRFKRVIKMLVIVRAFSCLSKYPLFFSDFNQNFNVSVHFSTTAQYQIWLKFVQGFSSFCARMVGHGEAHFCNFYLMEILLQVVNYTLVKYKPAYSYMQFLWFLMHLLQRTTVFLLLFNHVKMFTVETYSDNIYCSNN